MHTIPWMSENAKSIRLVLDFWKRSFFGFTDPFCILTFCFEIVCTKYQISFSCNHFSFRTFLSISDYVQKITVRSDSVFSLLVSQGMSNKILFASNLRVKYEVQLVFGILRVCVTNRVFSDQFLLANSLHKWNFYLFKLMWDGYCVNWFTDTTQL